MVPARGPWGRAPAPEATGLPMPCRRHQLGPEVLRCRCGHGGNRGDGCWYRRQRVCRCGAARNNREAHEASDHTAEECPVDGDDLNHLRRSFQWLFYQKPSIVADCN